MKENKKKVMKRILILVLVLSFFKVGAQQDVLGVSFDAGVSRIKDAFSIGDEKIGYSGNIGVYYDRYFNSKSLIEIELLYTLLTSNSTFMREVFGGSGSEEGVFEESYQLRGYYVSVPISYGIEHNDFIYTLGGQASININNFVELESEAYPDFDGTIEVDRYQKIDFGVRASVQKILDNGFVLSLKYYHGLVNMTDGEGSYSQGIHIKNRQLTLGVKYEFYRRLF